MNFRTNIKLSFEQWKFRKLQFIFLTVQIIFSFLLVCFIFQQFFSNRQLMSQMQKYMGKGDIYVLWNNNEPEWEQELEKDKYNRKFRELINKVRTTNVDILVLNNEYETSIKEKSTNLLYITPDFFDRYGITGDFSDREIHKLFCTQFVENVETEKILPAIAGADFRHEYKKGDVIQGDSGEQYRIVGFFKKRILLCSSNPVKKSGKYGSCTSHAGQGGSVGQCKYNGVSAIQSVCCKRQK